MTAAVLQVDAVVAALGSLINRSAVVGQVVFGGDNCMVGLMQRRTARHNISSNTNSGQEG